MKTKPIVPTVRENLESSFPGQVLKPASRADIPKKKAYMVYVLVRNDHAIVTGHGKFNRAQVIFDDMNHVTKNHIKAIYVRLYHLYGQSTDRYERYVIVFPSKAEAVAAESAMHKIIGGNKLALPDSITEALFCGLNPQGRPMLFLKIALASAYDGFTDLRGWQKLGLIEAMESALIAIKLGLADLSTLPANQAKKKKSAK